MTATNVGYNGSLTTGATASFGFNGSWTTANPVPTTFTFNGVTCTGSATSASPTTTGSSPTASPSPTASASPSASPSPTKASPIPTGGTAAQVTVAKDGSGNYTTVQAAINAAPSNSSSTYTIAIKPGDYHEIVSVPSTKTHLALVGTTGVASDVVIEYNNASGTTKPSGGTYGTAGSASVTVSANDFTARNLTFSNIFDEASSSLTDKQAVALNTQADRVTYDNVRFLGNQDTLLL